MLLINIRNIYIYIYRKIYRKIYRTQKEKKRRNKKYRKIYRKIYRKTKTNIYIYMVHFINPPCLHFAIRFWKLFCVRPPSVKPSDSFRLPMFLNKSVQTVSDSLPSNLPTASDCWCFWKTLEFSQGSYRRKKAKKM